MLRVILALLSVTTTASAAMPFDLPPPVLPAPTIPALRDFKIADRVLPSSFKIPPSANWSISLHSSELPLNAILGLIELFGSAERYRTALESTRVEVVRLSSAPPGAVYPDGYSESEPVKLVGWQADILRRTLTADSTYIWDTELTERPECIPTFEIRIRLHRGSTTLTAELSTSSRMIRILEGNTFISEQPLSERGFGRLLFLEPN